MPNSKPTTGWDLLHQWGVRWLPIIGGFIAVLVAIFSGIKYVVSSEVSEMAHDITTIKNTIQPLPEAIHSLDNRTTKMETHWEDLKLSKLSLEPTSKENVAAVKRILQNSQASNLPLSSDTILEAGRRFLDVSTTNPSAWDAVNAILEYKTFLNSPAVPPITNPTPISAKFTINTKPNPNIQPTPDHPVLVLRMSGFGGAASEQDSARVGLLSQPTESLGSHFVLIEGKADSIVLDGVFLKNVVIKDADVIYDGGPTQLENVYFVNCTLHFHLRPKSIALSHQILAYTPVSFSAPSA
jgi:hypothetical protein